MTHLLALIAGLVLGLFIAWMLEDDEADELE